MIFGALIVLLIGLTLTFLIVPVWRKPAPENTLDREQQNIDIAREKKALLETQLADKVMTQAEYVAAMTDLETALAIDLERQQTLRDNHESGKWAIVLFAIFVPALSLAMYFQLGSYEVIDNPALELAQTQPSSVSGKLPSIEKVITSLQNHLDKNPDDARGWYLLARTYMSLQQYQKSVEMFRRSYALTKNEPAIMLGLADALSIMLRSQGTPTQASNWVMSR